jgi:hypothetical protein
MVAMNVIYGQEWGQATEFPAQPIPLVFTRLAWREIGSQSPFCKALEHDFGG